MTPEMDHLPGDNGLLPFQLRRIITMLPLASATIVKVLAQRIDAFGRRLDNRAQSDFSPRSLVDHNLTRDELAGQGTVDKIGLAIEPGDGRATMGHSVGP